MSCVVSLVDTTDRLAVSAAVRRTGEATWATVRFHVVGEPVEVTVQTADAAALVHLLLRAAQQVCDKAVAAGVVLPGAGWGRAALLLDEALVALAERGESDG